MLMVSHHVFFKLFHQEGIFACMVGKGSKMSMELADIPNIR